MESVLNPSLKELASMAINQKLIMQGVGWDFYEEILAEYVDSNALHFAYDDGVLEVEVPLPEHEVPSRILSDLVTIISIELNVNARNFGSTTFRQQKNTKGCEPDTAFYIKNEPKIRGLLKIDLTVDPPPDLVIEVDVTSPSLDKLPIYAALGVSEVWLYKGAEVEFFQLVGKTYRKVSHSISFPVLSTEKSTEFLNKGLTAAPNEWFKEVKDWVNSQK
ncbi:MAG: Uma2 family endonuclease [Pyrinomonadaceae bacterium]|nr:Uma2 family endonuclease [Pyrinomonadaceae bacterium]